MGYERRFDPDSAGPMVTAGLAAAGALTLEHVLLWHKSIRLERDMAYLLGVATLGVAYGCWALPAREYRAFAAAIVVASLGGTPVLIGYWLRRRLEAERNAGRIAGRIDAMEGKSDAPAPRRDGRGHQGG